MKLTNPINLKAELPAQPENVKFFEVLTAKMQNHNKTSIGFNDVLFCEKTDVITPDFYVLTKATGNKLGIIRSLEENGDFILESNGTDKDIFPDYRLNINDFESVYRLISLSRNRSLQVFEIGENWDDFDDVKEWEPETIEDRVTYSNNIAKYLL